MSGNDPLRTFTGLCFPSAPVQYVAPWRRATRVLKRKLGAQASVTELLLTWRPEGSTTEKSESGLPGTSGLMWQSGLLKASPIQVGLDGGRFQAIFPRIIRRAVPNDIRARVSETLRNAGGPRSHTWRRISLRQAGELAHPRIKKLSRPCWRLERTSYWHG